MLEDLKREQASSTIGTMLYILWGLVVWGLQFTASYVGHTWLCAIGAPPTAADILVVALAVLAVLLIAPVALMPQRMAALAGVRMSEEDRGHVALIGQVIAWLSLVAAVWTTAGTLFIQACVLAR